MFEDLKKNDRDLKDMPEMNEAFRSAVAAMLKVVQLERLSSGRATEEDRDATASLASMFLVSVQWTLVQLCGAAEDCAADEAPRAVMRRLCSMLDEHTRLAATIKGLH